jgi:transglutaminase-like putative cysteine protease
MRFLKHEKNRTLSGCIIQSDTGEFESGRERVCLIKAILMFCSSFGTIACVLTAFSIEANYAVLIVFLLAAAFIMSFLRYNPVIFDLGYIAIMFGFIALVLNNRTIVNSGYQAMVNIIREEYQNYFGLNYTNEAAEAVSDRYRAVTIALLFLGFFLLILLNLAISSHMSVLWNIVLTFPFLQLGLYIGKRPSLLAMSLLLVSYVMTLCLKRTGHYRLVTTRKKDSPMLIKKNRVSYKTHGKTMAQLLAWVFVFVIAFSLIAYPVATFATPEQNGTSSLKAATDKVVENITQSGFASLLNRYAASGGVSGGKLGGVARVSADYETDLKVTFVPTSMETLYLKGYTGAVYTSTQWLAPDGDAADIEDEAAFWEADSISRAGGLYGKMEIRNLDASPDYLYLPYYTSASDLSSAYTIDHGTILGRSPVGRKYTLGYYPYTQLTKENESDQELPEGYLDSYLEIPDTVSEALNEAMAEIGETDGINDTISKINAYFGEEFKYTVSPGATPGNQDFVSYFLTKQKKGYCAHFATAGTLLCRAYGIPARYVEGYAVSLSDLADSTVEENMSVDDWLTGENDLEDAAVVTVDVPDANAHAWTEIYIEGFGWSPVDFTPASDDADESEEYSSLMSLFRGLFSLASGSGDSTDSASGSSSQGSAAGFSLSGNMFFMIPLTVLALAVILFLPAVRLIRRVREKRRVQSAYKSGAYDEVLPYYYNRLRCAVNERTGCEMSGEAELPQNFFERLAGLIKRGKRDRNKKAAEIFERGVYGRGQIKKEEMDFFIKYVKRLKESDLK